MLFGVKLFYSDSNRTGGNFLHYSVNLIRQWGFNGYIAIGGPYATSSYNTLLNDKNIDFAMIGEGEETFMEVIKQIILGSQENLEFVKGVVFRKSESYNQINIGLVDYM